MVSWVSLCVVVAAVILVPVVRGEMFTALVHMEGLMDLEMELLASLNTYITAEKQRLNELETFSRRVSDAHALYSGQASSTHLYDPVNAFQLVNRYSNKWLQLHSNLYTDNSKVLMANISINNYRLPTSEDFSGAVTALHRLQATYKLPPSELSSGKLGKNPSLTMTAEDCFFVGREAYRENQWKLATQWMKEALRKYDEEGSGRGSDLDLALVYDHLAFAEYKSGNYKRAVQYTRDLLQNEPTHERALSNLEYFDSLRKEKPTEFVDKEDEEDEEKRTTGSGRIGETETELYEATCREGKPLPSKYDRKLMCFLYTNQRNPRLILRPIKVEVLYPDPKIYVFHDFLNDKEIERLKILAGPKLQRATARNHATGEFEKADYRISKSGWLSPEDDSLGYVSRIDQRIGDVTGLTMETAEQLQVVNYGIGGHYEPHYDFARVDEDAFSRLGTGNRLSTVLIYMSDVELGGATAFPQLGLRIAPSKGSAAYWWNLKKSGDGDLRTRHAGCPVLVGSKWVCNKWIHETGQEFRRPCGLSRNQ